MMFRRLTQRETAILVVCILAVSSYVAYSFVFKPFNQGISILEDKIRVVEQQLKKDMALKGKSKEVEKQYEVYSANLKQKESDEKQMASILAEIQSVAGVINVRLADMKPKKVKRVDFYNQFSVSLAIDGQLETIVHFLYILQNAPHFFSADEIYLEKSSVRTSEIKCRLVVSRFLIP
ncbi:MAG: type 4a pilus biogenesis protein PilO [Candidatus Omnitrophota bacterium]